MAHNKLTFKDFAEALTEKLQEHYEYASVNLRENVKNNGLKLTGVEIREGSTNITPVIYLNSFYENYMQGEADVDGIFNAIRIMYEQSRYEEAVNVDWVENWEEVKNKVFYQLINAERNAERLKDTPHVNFLDLAYIFKIVVAKTERGTATVTVNNEIAENWGKDVSEIMQEANKNQTKLTGAIKVSGLDNVLSEIAEEMQDENIQELISHVDTPIQMLVATNSSNQYGAYVGFKKDILKGLSKKTKTDIAILPSSIHECLLTPLTKEIDKDFLKDMPRYVNESTLEPQDVLSNNVYIYNAVTDGIELLKA